MDNTYIVGYRLKNKNPKGNMIWIGKSCHSNSYITGPESRCIIFKLETIQHEQLLWKLVKEHKLELVKTNYRIKGHMNKIEVLDDYGRLLNINTQLWKIFDWEDDFNTSVIL